MELHGYKTFASRTEFQFPGMTTAIVGPNGSGKSNIADALRWVLGEQSYSLLRGRKTEDMIFNGSEQRARAGMASATITFDNDDNWLPIEFSEVAITRRAYRDGNNEYLLNGQRVRLREISELLAQSGLAERTYTIIGQGLVDAALALKPEERRRLFEEAAGIGLYRARREESINRLETTRRNLERVQDILAELEPRLHSLERQARRAMEYEHLRSDLRELLKEWYGFHWHQLQTELVHTKEVFHAQEGRLEQAQKRYEEVNQEVVIFRTQIGEIRNCLNDWYSRSSELHQNREKISRELAILEERQRAFTNQCQDHQSDQARLEGEIQAVEARIAKVQGEHSRLSGELQEAHTQVETARKAQQERVDQRSQVERAMREARQRLVSAETRLVQRKAHQDEMTHRINAQVKALEASQTALQTSQVEMEKAQSRLQKINEQRQLAEDHRKNALATLQKLQLSLAELDGERKLLLDDRTRLEGNHARLNVQIEAINQAEQSFAGLAEGAKTLLLAHRQGRLTGGFTSLSTQLDVPAMYETAIAAALGEFLDVLFVDSGHNPEEALDFLKSSGKGRAALLPMDWVNRQVSPIPPQDPDCLGCAANLVHAPAGIREAVTLLLGSVLIVSDRAAARRLLQAEPEFSRAVTLQGEVFHAGGAIFAGRETRGAALSHPRQRRELQQQADEIDIRIQALNEKINEFEIRYNQGRANESVLEKAVREANTQFEKTAEAAQSGKYSLEQARRQVEWHSNQRKTIDAQQSRSREEQLEGEEEIGRLQAEIQSRREEVSQISTVLASLPLDELQSQVAHWSTTAAVAIRAVKDAENRLVDNQQTLEKSRQQQASLRVRIEGLQNDILAAENERIRLHQQESIVLEQIEALRMQIEPAEKEVHRSEKEYTRLQEVETATQQALGVAQRYASQAQMEMTRQREAVDNLRRRIEEDFGLVALEYEENVAGPIALPLEGLVEQLPEIPEVPADLEAHIARLRAQMRRMGPVNPEAQREYQEVRDRFNFMTSQVADLKTADADL
ncbi:MAG: chromosome segregation protein SMC, partial [Anaerolineaceae bacterium]|nr:chromosome segregation protein SMC [Anaerolineaceae bacterium]